jgi:Tol biopolymer transport system component
VKPDGSDDHPFTTSLSNDLAPTWSSDSSHIIYAKDHFWGHDHDLYTVSFADGNETLLSGLDWPEDTPAIAA